MRVCSSSRVRWSRWTSYRAARADELPALPDKGEVLAQLVLVALHQHGPATLSQCAERVAMEEPELSQILAALVEDGRAQRTEHRGTERYRCDHVMIGYHDPNGWQAAVYDHYQALVGALCHKLQLSLTHATPDEHVGGSTYTFDLWRGHAYEHEVLGLLSRLRSEAVALRQRVEAYNRDQSSPDDEQRFRVVAYVGQSSPQCRRDSDCGSKQTCVEHACAPAAVQGVADGALLPARQES